MTVTATPATIAPRFVLADVTHPQTDHPGARLHTDEDLPSEFQREVLAARAGERAAQALANEALLDLAISEGSLATAQQALYDLAVQNEAYCAQLTATRPVIEMAGLVAHGHRGEADMRQAYTTYVEEGPR